jgi:predicted extracellular nuclease
MAAFTTLQRRPRAAFAFLALTGVAATVGCGGSYDAKPPEALSASPALPAVFACAAPATPIAALTRDASLVRQQVMPRVIDVEGVVVGNFQGGLGGFFLQSGRGDADADPATAEGMFVEYRGDAPAPRVGQRMRVRGEWSASDDPARSELALRKIASLLDCGEAPLPDPVDVSAPPADWSHFAGMRLHAPGPLTLTGNHTLLRYGELWLSIGDRLVSPTELVMPGGAAQVRADDDARRLLVVDDGRGGEYPRRLWHLPAEPGSKTPFRTGSILRGVEGVLDRRFGSWRLQLTVPVGSVDQAPRPVVPEHDSALLRIASFNVLNFFNGDGAGGGFPTERGAGSRNDLRRQRDKLVAAMLTLDADVYALMEIENDGFAPGSAVADLAGALSSAVAETRADAPGTAGSAADALPVGFDYIDAERTRLGSDSIAVALIYRSDRVRPIGEPMHLAGGPFDTDSRVPLAQAFTAIGSGDEGAFRVVVNHFKSKGCSDAQGDNRDADDGQSCYAPVRTASARRLIKWLQDVPEDAVGADRTLVLGDLIAHAREDAVRALLDRGFVDLLADGGGHSFVFSGRAGRLDHALAGAGVAKRVRSAGIWHINADELPEFDYDGDARSGRRLFTADPYRSSDHDPVYVDLTP